MVSVRFSGISEFKILFSSCGLAWNVLFLSRRRRAAPKKVKVFEREFRVKRGRRRSSEVGLSNEMSTTTGLVSIPSMAGRRGLGLDSRANPSQNDAEQLLEKLDRRKPPPMQCQKDIKSNFFLKVLVFPFSS